MTNCFLAYSMINNGYNPRSHALLIQRLLAAQQPLSDFENANFTGFTPLLARQFLGANVLMHDQVPMAHPSALSFVSAANVAPSYGMLQAMMMVNNERSTANRASVWLQDTANQGHAARLLVDRVSQQERLIQSNDRSLKRIELSNSITQLHREPAAVRDGKHAELVVQSQRQGALLVEADEGISKATKKKASKDKASKPKQDTKWLVFYDELRQYREEYGDCIVPRGFTFDPRLASWVAEQRKQYKLRQDGKNSSITPKRIELLNEIGFAWNAQEAAWERHLTDLKGFKEEFGDCLVPLEHPKYPKLGLWVKEQRRHYTLMKQSKPSHMTEERARALNTVGFCWDTHEAVWGERLRELAEYKARFGDCKVPTNFSANPKLGTWVHHQRRQYKKLMEGKRCHITAKRVRALESIGFVWFPRERVRHSQAASSESDTESELEDWEDDIDLRPKKRQRLRGN